MSTYLRISFLFFVTILLLFFFTNVSLASQGSMNKQEALLFANNAIGNDIGNYTLIDQNGKRFKLRELIGKPFIVNFIYTGCGHICPTLTMSVGKAIKDSGKDFGTKYQAITIGFDFENDTPQRMNEYGRSFTNDFKNWRFATSDRDTISRMAEDFGFFYKKIRGGYDHLNAVTIVDSRGKIYKHVYGLEITSKEILDPIYQSINIRKGDTEDTGFSTIEFSALINNGIKLLCYEYDESTGTYKFSYTLLVMRVVELIIVFGIIYSIWAKGIRSLFSRIFGKGNAISYK